MAEKTVLVAYATRYGSARIVAEDIRSHMEGSGVKVALVDLRKDRVPGNLKDYSLVVVGSSVAMFSWMAAAKNFLRKCKRAGVRPAIYITCGMAIEEPEKAISKFMDKVVKRTGVKPVLTEAIPPAIDFRPGGIPENVKKRIKGTIQAMLKDEYQDDGLMDKRDAEKFNVFLGELVDFLNT